VSRSERNSYSLEIVQFGREIRSDWRQVWRDGRANENLSGSSERVRAVRTIISAALENRQKFLGRIAAGTRSIRPPALASR